MKKLILLGIFLCSLNNLSLCAPIDDAKFTEAIIATDLEKVSQLLKGPLTAQQKQEYIHLADQIISLRLQDLNYDWIKPFLSGGIVLSAYFTYSFNTALVDGLKQWERLTKIHTQANVNFELLVTKVSLGIVSILSITAITCLGINTCKAVKYKQNLRTDHIKALKIKQLILKA